MSDKQKWHGNGIIEKMRTGRDGKPYSKFFVRAWIPSEKRTAVFEAGRGIESARRLRKSVLANPERHMAERKVAVQKKVEGVTVQMLYNDFLANYQSRGGTDYYREILKGVIASMGALKVTEVTADNLDAYLKGRRGTAGASTMRKECIAINKLFKWARGRKTYRDILPANPFADYDKPAEPAGPPARALTEDEEDRLLTASPPLERDVVAWALDTGMRIGEIEALPKARIDADAGIITVLGTKTNKYRQIPMLLSERIMEVYRRQVDRFRDGGLLFRSDRGGPLSRKSNNVILTAAFENAGIPRMQGNLWTVLRKTWTTRVYDNGATAEQEAAWGGHSITVANKHYREHGHNVTRGAAGLLDRRTDRAQDRARKVVTS